MLTLCSNSATYGSKLTAVMQKMVLISQVAKLGRQLERDNIPGGIQEGDHLRFPSLVNTLLDDNDDDDDTDSAVAKSQAVIGGSQPYKVNATSSERQTLLKLLDQWEEPAEELSVVSLM